ncbi:hypothetical protein MMC29_001119 [Sticta canariensis]|nr:hypothetical protein [Sticta canariensis]
MYLLLFIITAISTAIANPLPADEAHREKPLKFSLGKDVRPSTYRESAYRDQNVPDASSYGTILNEHQIPSGITSEYSVGDLHLPLQATKALDLVIGNGRKEMDLDVPEEAFTNQELLYSWKKPQDGAQPSSECGKSKSVCCTTSFKWGGSVVKACEKAGRVFQWGSPCQDPQYLDTCDELWAVIDERNASMAVLMETLDDTGRWPKSDSEGRTSNVHDTQNQLPRNLLLLRLQETEPAEAGNLTVREGERSRHGDSYFLQSTRSENLPSRAQVAELGHGATGGFGFLSVGKAGIYGEYGVWADE